MIQLLLFSILGCCFLTIAAINVEECPAGFYCIPKAVTPIACPPGTWSAAGSGKCQPCETGYYSTKGGSSYCIKCEQGHYCGTAELPPEPCPLGFFNNELAQTQCSPCMPGTYTPAPGAVQCTICPAGSSCSNAGALSKPCPPGKFLRSIINSSQ